MLQVKLTRSEFKNKFLFCLLLFSDGLEKRFGSLSSSVSERAEQLQTAVAQSVSVQEGLKGLLSWLDQLVLNPGPVTPTAQAVQETLTQNQVGVILDLQSFITKSPTEEAPSSVTNLLLRNIILFACDLAAFQSISPRLRAETSSGAAFQAGQR